MFVDATFFGFLFYYRVFKFIVVVNYVFGPTERLSKSLAFFWKSVNLVFNADIT